ncbi:MAG: T9SS C-terminal target domain-containing protein [Bacteroidetes bacterium]|nr:MAG: T9SS C-terminal target domain-containing protein [Bacteroidota bacterium]
MKKQFWLLLGLSFAFIAGIQWIGGQYHFSGRPLPTDRAAGHEEDETRRLEREAWIKHMHRAAPGVDWKAMDREVRLRQAQERFRRIKAAESRGLASDYYKDTLAGGNLVGHWREVGSNNQAGRIHLAEYDQVNDKLYLASSGGNIWVGNTSGSNWQVRNNLLQIPDIQMMRVVEKPGGGTRLLVASGGWGVTGFQYSDDDGLTWTLSAGLQNIKNWGFVTRAVVSSGTPRSIYLLALEWDYVNWQSITALYYSNDLGVSFTRLREFPTAVYGSETRLDIWTDERSASPVFVMENHRVHRINASNQLELLDSLVTNPPGDVRLSGRNSPSGLYLYALYQNNNSSDIYRSKEGNNWSFRGTSPSGLFFRGSFACSATDPNLLFTGGLNVYRSADGGSNWSLVNEWWEYYGNPAAKLHADIPGFNSFLTASQQEFTIVSTDGGAYISTDGLQTVQNISLNGLGVSQYYSTYTHRQNPSIIYAGAQDQGYQRSSEDAGGAVNFNQLISGDYGHLVSANGGQSIWCNYPGFTMYYPDAANSTNALFRDFDCTGNLWLAPLAADPVSANVAWLAGGAVDGSGAHLIKLTAINNNISYQEMPFDFSLGTQASISAIAFSTLTPGYRYVMTDNNEFFVSPNGGTNWTQSAFSGIPGSHYFYGNAIFPSKVQAGRVYIAGSGYSGSSVYKSEDHGLTFVSMDIGLPQTLVYDIDATADESLIFAATEIGPYVYVAADQQWYPLSGISAPDQTYWTVEYVPALHAARFGTYGRGIWDFTICDDVAPAPVAAFSNSVDLATLTIQLTNTSEKAYFYQWDFGDGTTSESASPAHTYAATGTYTVSLIASSHCRSDTFTREITFSNTAVDGADFAGFAVYPNPVQRDVYLRTPKEIASGSRVELISAQGQVLWTEQTERVNAGAAMRLHIPELPAGVYLLKLQDNSGKVLTVKKIRVGE